MNKKILTICIIIILATAITVAYADSNGWFSINNSRVLVSNSTVTINNSNVTIGQNNTITYAEPNPTTTPIQTPTPSPTPSPAPTPTPTVYVSVSIPLGNPFIYLGTTYTERVQFTNGTTYTEYEYEYIINDTSADQATYFSSYFTVPLAEFSGNPSTHVLNTQYLYEALTNATSYSSGEVEGSTPTSSTWLSTQINNQIGPVDWIGTAIASTNNDFLFVIGSPFQLSLEQQTVLTSLVTSYIGSELGIN